MKIGILTFHNADNYGASFTLEFEQISHDANNQYTELKRGVYANAFAVNGDGITNNLMGGE